MNKKIITLRIILTSLCCFMTVFIFSQSLQAGEDSAKTSASVTDVVQQVAQQIAPESFVATATGEDYDLLHAAVRMIAHYSEFALLGFLLCFCYFSYTRKRIWALAPLGVLVVVPILDESLQILVADRACEWLDVLYDFCGGVTGFGFALLLWTLGRYLYRVIRLRRKSV